MTPQTATTGALAGRTGPDVRRTRRNAAVLAATVAATLGLVACSDATTTSASGTAASGSTRASDVTTSSGTTGSGTSSSGTHHRGTRSGTRLSSATGPSHASSSGS